MARPRHRDPGGTASHRQGGRALHVRDEGRVASISVSGRLEEGAEDELRCTARALRLSGVLLLVLDLHELDAIDSPGAIAVLELEAEGREHEGWELAVAPPSPGVAPEFSSTEMREILNLVAPEDARYMVDFYAASMRASRAVLGAEPGSG